MALTMHAAECTIFDQNVPTNEERRRFPIRRLGEVREGLGIGQRPWSREVGLNVSTVQHNEGGGALRPATAWKYVPVLRKYGIDPNEVEEIRESLGELFFTDADPAWVAWNHTIRAWEELTRGLVATGHLEHLRERLERIAEERGERGARQRAKDEEEYQRLVEENREEGD
jgi:DNA-binding transcriptional regulator YiaG